MSNAIHPVSCSSCLVTLLLLLLCGPAAPQGPDPAAMQRMEMKQRQNQYRAELEAQMRCEPKCGRSVC